MSDLDPALKSSTAVPADAGTIQPAAAADSHVYALTDQQVANVLALTNIGVRSFAQMPQNPLDQVAVIAAAGAELLAVFKPSAPAQG